MGKLAKTMEHAQAEQCNNSANKRAKQCNAEQHARTGRRKRRIRAENSVVVLDLLEVSLEALKTGLKTDEICEKIKSALRVDVDVLVLVHFGVVTDSSGELQRFYSEVLHPKILRMWSASLPEHERPVDLVSSVLANTVLVAATSRALKTSPVVMKDTCDQGSAYHEDIAQVGHLQLASGFNLVIACLSWRSNMPFRAMKRNMVLINDAIQHGFLPFLDKQDVPCLICGRFPNRALSTGGLVNELGGEYEMVSEGPDNPLLHAFHRNCKVSNGGESQKKLQAFNLLVKNRSSVMTGEQDSTSEQGSDGNAEQHACRKERVSPTLRNAEQRAPRTVTLTPRVTTPFFERFLENLTRCQADMTGKEQDLLDAIFQRYAGGSVRYYGRQGVCGNSCYSLAEKLDVMLEEVDKRRKRYIKCLPDTRRRHLFHQMFEQQVPVELTEKDLQQILNEWEHDFESWMNPEHWEGFHLAKRR